MSHVRVHAGRHYAVHWHYAVPDDGWCAELSEAVPAPASWTGAETHLPGPALVAVVVPDEDPDREPVVHVHNPDGLTLPYGIMLWFMEQVADEVERCRLAFEQAAAVQAREPGVGR